MLPMFFVGHANAGSASASEDRGGVVMVAIHSDVGPVRCFYFAGRFMNPEVGHITQFVAGLSGVSDDIDVARRPEQCDSNATLHVAPLHVRTPVQRMWHPCMVAHRRAWAARACLP
eukprot:9459788-Alexandrium_andersonii.AAC.1